MVAGFDKNAVGYWRFQSTQIIGASVSWDAGGTWPSSANPSPTGPLNYVLPMCFDDATPPALYTLDENGTFCISKIAGSAPNRSWTRIGGAGKGFCALCPGAPRDSWWQPNVIALEKETGHVYRWSSVTQAWEGYAQLAAPANLADRDLLTLATITSTGSSVQYLWSICTDGSVNWISRGNLSSWTNPSNVVMKDIAGNSLRLINLIQTPTTSLVLDINGRLYKANTGGVSPASVAPTHIPGPNGQAVLFMTANASWVIVYGVDGRMYYGTNSTGAVIPWSGS